MVDPHNLYVKRTIENFGKGSQVKITHKILHKIRPTFVNSRTVPLHKICCLYFKISSRRQKPTSSIDPNKKFNELTVPSPLHLLIDSISEGEEISVKTHWTQLPVLNPIPTSNFESLLSSVERYQSSSFHLLFGCKALSKD